MENYKFLHAFPFLQYHLLPPNASNKRCITKPVIKYPKNTLNQKWYLVKEKSLLKNIRAVAMINPIIPVINPTISASINTDVIYYNKIKLIFLKEKLLNIKKWLMLLFW